MSTANLCKNQRSRLEEEEDYSNIMSLVKALYGSDALCSVLLLGCALHTALLKKKKKCVKLRHDPLPHYVFVQKPLLLHKKIAYSTRNGLLKRRNSFFTPTTSNNNNGASHTYNSYEHQLKKIFQPSPQQLPQYFCQQSMADAVFIIPSFAKSWDLEFCLVLTLSIGYIVG